MNRLRMHSDDLTDLTELIPVGHFPYTLRTKEGARHAD